MDSASQGKLIKLIAEKRCAGVIYGKSGATSHLVYFSIIPFSAFLMINGETFSNNSANFAARFLQQKQVREHSNSLNSCSMAFQLNSVHQFAIKIEFSGNQHKLAR